MPTKSTWKDVKTQLQYFDQAQLIELLRKIWQDLPESKLYLMNAVIPGADISAEIERYRKIIKDRFFPTRGLGDMKLSRARKAINDFAKTHPPPVALAELMLFYVEQGVAFTAEYGDIDAAFLRQPAEHVRVAGGVDRDARDGNLRPAGSADRATASGQPRIWLGIQRWYERVVRPVGRGD